MTLECDKNKYSSGFLFEKKLTINQYETLHRLNLGLGTKDKYRAKSIRIRSGGNESKSRHLFYSN